MIILHVPGTQKWERDAQVMEEWMEWDQCRGSHWRDKDSILNGKGSKEYK